MPGDEPCWRCDCNGCVHCLTHEEAADADWCGCPDDWHDDDQECP